VGIIIDQSAKRYLFDSCLRSVSLERMPFYL
jgi:hypothetical protein